MLLLLVSVLLLPCLCTGCTDGGACNSTTVAHGICVRGTCLESIPSLPRENLTFIVIVRYPEATLKTHGGSQLYIRGSGLGLSWNKGTVIPKTSHDTWGLKLVYTSSINGYHCQKCADKQPLNGDKLQYRILVDDRVDMVGANFAIEFPLSKVSSYFSNERGFYSYPWFYQKSGNLSTIIVDSGDLGGNRSIGLYKPPSFFENVYKTYPVIFALDVVGNTSVVPLHMLDDPIVKSAVTEEFIVIGFGDYNQTERMDFLTPSTHDYFECKNGSFLDRCGGCYSENATEDLIAWLKLMVNKCGKLIPMGGKGNAVLDYLISKVKPAIQSLSNNRLSTDRENVGIIGYSLGGLMACHAAWTRPHDFGFAGCQSSSFWWPLEFGHDTVSAAFEFLNQTMLNVTLNTGRPHQRIYLDAGTLEDGLPFKMAGAAVEAAEKMTTMKGYEMDKNVWVNVYPGAVHSGLEWVLRLWKGLKTLLPSKGMRSMPNSMSPSIVG